MKEWGKQRGKRCFNLILTFPWTLNPPKSHIKSNFRGKGFFPSPCKNVQLASGVHWECLGSVTGALRASGSSMWEPIWDSHSSIQVESVFFEARARSKGRSYNPPARSKVMGSGVGGSAPCNLRGVCAAAITEKHLGQPHVCTMTCMHLQWCKPKNSAAPSKLL